MFARSALLALTTILPLVAAHGSLNFAIIDGTKIAAPDPNGDSGVFAIRAINDIDPVKGAMNADMTCGHGAQPAALVADANPGSTLQFSWRNGEGGIWVHNTGPVLTYMASCGTSGCANFTGADAQFFKIGELGRKEDLDWYMVDLTTGPDATTSVTLPTDLPAGEYLVRHELIALQLADQVGGAEFFPSCLQIRLAAPQGTPAPLPSGDQVVSFPGGYTDEDPGIHDTDIYNDKNAPYIFPGPAPISGADTSPAPSSPSSSSPSPSSTDPSTDVPANPAPSPSTSSPSPDTNPSSTSSSVTATPTRNNGCGGNRNTKKRTVVKRIVRQGPLIKKRSKEDKPFVKRDSAAMKREEVKRKEVKKAVIPNAHRIRADHPNNIVRSRVMRGVF